MAIIMAAGEGKRMKSSLPKVLHKACGRPIIDWVMDAVLSCSSADPVVIVGSGGERVRAYLGERAQYAVQERQLGTGHAAMMAAPYLHGRTGHVLIVAGDMPLLQRDTVLALCDMAKRNGYAAVMLTAVMDDPAGYGRVIRSDDGGVSAIIEHRDAGEEVLRVREVNASVYCFEIEAFLRTLKSLSNNNDQGEYYLTDCIGCLVREGRKVGALVAADPAECMGVNDRAQLAQASKVLQERIIRKHMHAGVTFIDPQNTCVEHGVAIGRDTVVYPGNVLEGNTQIGEDCVIYPGCRITNSVVGDGASIQSSVLCDCIVGNRASVGPFAHLRPGADIGQACRIGNFVEVKNTPVGKGSKVSHLTYVGDGRIGEDCNIGCGVVFVNYDGENKNITVVEDGAFVGCNSNLVAPVTVGKNAYVAAGSTITEDVPGDALAIARSRQVNKEGWSAKRRMEKQK
ncbi:MAG: bifunctional UDP-N-acetylglucosamine diphosphorylase/glucosamine-1-phosphate N-acetyltransferase GlmU [Bacillota bacterium]